MAVMKVLVYPEPPLKEVALPVVKFGEELKRLANDMIETMDSNLGVGLAAPQVGVRRQLLVLREPEDEVLCLVNPEIVEMDGKSYGEEGCLSLPEVYAAVPRATHIRVRAQDLDGEALDFAAHDFLARIIQHEYDHLQGKMFPDRLDVLSRDAVLKEWDEVRAGLDTDASVAG